MQDRIADRLGARADGAVEALDADADRRVADGSAPVQRALFAAEHSPHAPDGWQAGVAPPHSPSPAQARQACVARSQTGVAPAALRVRGAGDADAAGRVAGGGGAACSGGVRGRALAARARGLAGGRRAAAVAVGGAGAAAVRGRVAHGRGAAALRVGRGRRRRCPRVVRHSGRRARAEAGVASPSTGRRCRTAGRRASRRRSRCRRRSRGRCGRCRRTRARPPAQSASARQVTQVPLGAWQSGVVPVHGEVFVAEHWPQAPRRLAGGRRAAAFVVAGAGAADVRGRVADRRDAAALGVGDAVHAGAAGDVAGGRRAAAAGGVRRRADAAGARRLAGGRARRRSRRRRRRPRQVCVVAIADRRRAEQSAFGQAGDAGARRRQAERRRARAAQELPAEHWPQVPPGWQAGVAPPHSLSPLHARQVCDAGSQTGVATGAVAR